jgi:hypothetical protein
MNRTSRTIGSTWAVSVSTLVFAVLVFLVVVPTLVIVSILIARSNAGTLDETTDPTNANILSDLAYMQIALAQEHLLVAAYANVLVQYPTFTAIGPTANGWTTTGAQILTLVTQFGATASSHVTALTGLIQAQCSSLPTNLQTDCTPVPACTYVIPTFGTQLLALTYLMNNEIDLQRYLVGVSPSLTNPANGLETNGILAVESAQVAVLRLWNVIAPTGGFLVVAPITESVAVCLASASVSTPSQTTCLPFSGYDLTQC